MFKISCPFLKFQKPLKNKQNAAEYSKDINISIFYLIVGFVNLVVIFRCTFLMLNFCYKISSYLFFSKVVHPVAISCFRSLSGPLKSDCSSRRLWCSFE